MDGDSELEGVLIGVRQCNFVAGGRRVFVPMVEIVRGKDILFMKVVSAQALRVFEEIMKHGKIVRVYPYCVVEVMMPKWGPACLSTMVNGKLLMKKSFRESLQRAILAGDVVAILKEIQIAVLSLKM